MMRTGKRKREKSSIFGDLSPGEKKKKKERVRRFKPQKGTGVSVNAWLVRGGIKKRNITKTNAPKKKRGNERSPPPKRRKNGPGVSIRPTKGKKEKRRAEGKSGKGTCVRGGGKG